MDQLLTADFNCVMLYGRPVDRAGFIDRVQKMPDSNTWTTPPDVLIRFYGSTAIVTYGVPHGTPVEYVNQFTQVWVKVDGNGWRMARLHSSTPTLNNQTKK